jgi:putative transposase
MQTFFGDEDYRAYLSLLVEWCRRREVAIWGYWLMPNHVHLIVVPSSEDALARAIGEAHRRYTRRVNFREGWRGHFWEDRFASFVLDEPYLLSAARYIEMNPVRAKLVKRPQDWPWSSAAAHMAGRGDAVAQGQWLREQTVGWVCTWGEFLLQRVEEDLAAKLRLHERTGRPLGERPFVQRLEQSLARALLPGKPGRPRNKPTT